MVEKTYLIHNNQGLHMRPAGLVANAMMKMECDVNLIVNEEKVNAKSIMSLMAACIKKGSEITLVCDGPQQEEAIRTFDELYHSSFGE